MPIHHTADLPVVEYAPCQAGSGPRRLRNVIGEIDRKEMAGVEIAVAVIPPRIVIVIHDRGAALADLLQSVRPSGGKLRGQPAPRPQSGNGLQRIVVGSPTGVELKD